MKSLVFLSFGTADFDNFFINLFAFTRYKELFYANGISPKNIGFPKSKYVTNLIPVFKTCVLSQGAVKPCTISADYPS